MIPYEYEYLFKQDSVHKDIKIVYDGGEITNTEIMEQNFKITDSLCSENQLKFGCCEGKKVEFIVGYGEAPLEGKELTISITPEGGTEFQLGVFTVVSDIPTADRRRRQITAYDQMYQILNTECIEWYNGLFIETPHITIRQFRDSLFSFLGFNQAYRNISSTLPTDNMTISKTVTATSLSGKDIITALCEVNLLFGHINENNEFEYVVLVPIGESLYPAEDLYPAENLYPSEGSVDEEVGQNGNYISAKYEDYFVEPIDKFQVRMEENDIGYVVGSGTNAYIIEGNFLLYGKSSDDLDAIYWGVLSYLSTIWFVPAEIVALGNPCLQVGDRIRLHTKYATIDTYILQRTLGGIQGLRDNYVAESSRLREEQLNSVNHSVLALQGRTNVLDRTIEETRLEMTELGESVTEVTVKADGLETRVESIENQLDGTINQYEGEGTPTLLNYPYWDFTTNLPCDGTIQCAPIYDADGNVGGDEYPHFVYTEADKQAHIRDLYIDLDTGNGYRFLPNNSADGWSWEMIQDSDFAILFNQISEIRQDVDSIELEVSDTELTVANHETRITQNTANISTQATQISAKVSQVDENSSHTFGWNLTSAEWNVKSNGSTVLKVDSTGLTVKGNVTARTGYIGNGSSGFEIGNTYIRNGMTSLSDTINDGVYVGTNGIALGKGAFKVTKSGELTAHKGVFGNYEIEEGKGIVYMDGSSRNGGIYGGVVPENRSGKGIFIDGQMMWVGITKAMSIYRENAPWEDDICTFGYDNGHTYINSRWFFGNNNGFSISKNTTINGNLTVTGSKNRVVETESKGKRLLYAYETAEPYFGDIGEDTICSDGKCVVFIDDVFAETVQTKGYQVFLQAYGKGECYVTERKDRFFVVEGTAGLSFGWEIKAKQIDMSDKRLEKGE